jgi:hypothetical protein
MPTLSPIYAGSLKFITFLMFSVLSLHYIINNVSPTERSFRQFEYIVNFIRL